MIVSQGTLVLIRGQKIKKISIDFIWVFGAIPALKKSASRGSKKAPLLADFLSSGRSSTIIPTERGTLKMCLSQ